MRIRELFSRFIDRRRHPRIEPVGLVAHYWTGGTPMPRGVRNIGLCGAYIVAPDAFYPATLLQIILENEANEHETICVCGQVRRKAADGFCVAFLFGDVHERRQLRRFLHNLCRRVSENMQKAAPTQMTLEHVAAVADARDEAAQQSASDVGHNPPLPPGGGGS